MTRGARAAAAASLVAAALLVARTDAQAQARPVPAIPEAPAFSMRLFGDVGADRFAARRSFNAVLGKESGVMYGGGAEAVLRSGWFVRFGVWRLKEDGERAVRFENQTFRLGIPLTVTIIPIEVSAGYRLPLGRRRSFVPYVGGGLSSFSYKETSSFADGNENVNERATGYQFLGGLEYRMHRVVGLAGEVQYTTVPDAIGAGGLSAEFDEKDLGGLMLRVRVLFGR
jgi:hypothetical protein